MTTRPFLNVDTFTSHEITTMDTSDDLLSLRRTRSLPKLAAQLSARPYLTMFEHALENPEAIIRAWHPEFSSGDIRYCTAIGCTEAEASQRLEEASYLLILTLLQADLPVPNPISDTTPYVFPELSQLSK